jgi:hypothetical protein
MSITTKNLAMRTILAMSKAWDVDFLHSHLVL